MAPEGRPDCFPEMQEDRVRMSRKISLCTIAAAVVVATVAARAEEPELRIAKQGSMEAGGRTIDCERVASVSAVWPGHYMIAAPLCSLRECSLLDESAPQPAQQPQQPR